MIVINVLGVKEGTIFLWESLINIDPEDRGPINEAMAIMMKNIREVNPTVSDDELHEIANKGIYEDGKNTILININHALNCQKRVKDDDKWQEQNEDKEEIDK